MKDFADYVDLGMEYLVSKLTKLESLTPKTFMKTTLSLTALFFGTIFLIIALSSYYIVPPGNRGVKVTLGEVYPKCLPEGFGIRLPIATKIQNISVRQETAQIDADCFSSDLQGVRIHVNVLFRIPEDNVVRIFQEFQGKPFDALIVPRIQEALKEVTALLTAEQIVKKREEVKMKALEYSRHKIDGIVVINDLVINNIELSSELQKAIEQKMVQEQEAAKAKFKLEQAKVDAETAIVKANGEATAIKVRASAIKENPGVIDLMIAEKWNGVSPLVVGGGKSADVILPLNK